MFEPTPTAGRLRSFRLDQIPVRERVAALQRINRPDRELLVAALYPSDRIYRVSEAAFDAAMKSMQSAHSSRRRTVSYADLPG